MWWLFLVAIIAVFVIFAIVGLKKGFVKLLFSSLAMIIIIGLTIFFAPKAADYIEKNTNWEDGIYQTCEQYLSDVGIVKDPNVSLETSVEQSISDGLNQIALPMNMVKDLRENLEGMLNGGISEWNSYVVNTVGHAVFTIIVYIGMFVIAGILVLVVWLILHALSKVPGISAVNRIGGMLLGLVQGLLVVWILLLILAVVFNNGWLKELNTYISSNDFLLFLYRYNPLSNLLYVFTGVKG